MNRQIRMMCDRQSDRQSDKQVEIFIERWHVGQERYADYSSVEMEMNQYKETKIVTLDATGCAKIANLSCFSPLPANDHAADIFLPTTREWPPLGTRMTGTSS